MLDLFYSIVLQHWLTVFPWVPLSAFASRRNLLTIANSLGLSHSTLQYAAEGYGPEAHSSPGLAVDAADRAAPSLPTDSQDHDTSMISTTPATPKHSKGGSMSKQKERTSDGGDGAVEKEKEKEKDKDKDTVGIDVSVFSPCPDG